MPAPREQLAASSQTTQYADVLAPRCFAVLRNFPLKTAAVASFDQV